MPAPLAVQLYTVRDAIAADFEGTLRRLAAMGFVGVEFAGVYGASPDDAVILCRDLGLQIASAHMPLPIGEKASQIIDTATALGIETAVCPWMPPQRFTSMDEIKSVCDELNAAEEVYRSHGLRLAYHNHDFEFRPLADGSLPHDHMRALCSPSILFEVDTYWVVFAGQDPVKLLSDLGDHAPLVHIKDGTGKAGDANVAVGDGVLDTPAVVNAASHAQWLIVEFDRSDTDIFAALEKSAQYMLTQGLAQGR